MIFVIRIINGSSLALVFLRSIAVAVALWSSPYRQCIVNSEDFMASQMARRTMRRCLSGRCSSLQQRAVAMHNILLRLHPCPASPNFGSPQFLRQSLCQISVLGPRAENRGFAKTQIQLPRSQSPILGQQRYSSCESVVHYTKHVISLPINI